MGRGLFWNHSEGDRVRISGECTEIKLFYKSVSGPRMDRRVILEIDGIGDPKTIELDDNEPVALSEERGMYVRIGGYYTDEESVRVHYIVDKKYRIEFL